MIMQRLLYFLCICSTNFLLAVSKEKILNVVQHVIHIKMKIHYTATEQKVLLSITVNESIQCLFIASPVDQRNPISLANNFVKHSLC